MLAVLAALLAHEQAAPPAAANGAAPRKGIAAGLIKWLEGEVDRLDKAGTVAPNTRFAVLGWAVTLYTGVLAADHEPDEPQWTSLVTSFSRLVDTLLDRTAPWKDSARHGVEVAARRVVRNVRRSRSPVELTNADQCGF